MQKQLKLVKAHMNRGTFTQLSDDLAKHDPDNDIIKGMMATHVWSSLGWHDIRLTRSACLRAVAVGNIDPLLSIAGGLHKVFASSE